MLPPSVMGNHLTIQVSMLLGNKAILAIQYDLRLTGVVSATGRDSCHFVFINFYKIAVLFVQINTKYFQSLFVSMFC